MNRWDELKNDKAFWDPNADEGLGREISTVMSDLSLVANPGQARYADILRAACNVIVELTEKVEKLEKERRS